MPLRKCRPRRAGVPALIASSCSVRVLTPKARLVG